jgi:hypothetical protein
MIEHETAARGAVDSATDFGSVGRGFESLRAGQNPRTNEVTPTVFRRGLTDSPLLLSVPHEWLAVYLTQAMSYWDTACGLFALASDCVPSLPA